jgi:MIP family channel proteins
MTKLPQRCAAEVVGTFFLCFVGVAVTCSNTFLAPHSAGSGLLGIALAQGLALAVAVSAVGRVSGGHFNPAVSAAAVLTGHLRPLAGVAYFFSQLAGGILGGLVARCAYSHIFPEGSIVDAYITANGGVPMPYPAVGRGIILLLEGIGAFFLVLAVFGTAIDLRPPRVGGFAIGLTLTLDILAFGPITGASVNPARALGAALATYGTSAFEHVWTYHETYWVGPLLGGLIAGQLYKSFFSTIGAASAQPTAPE